MTLYAACERVITEADLRCDCDISAIFGGLSDEITPPATISPYDEAMGGILDAACDALARVTGIPVGRCTSVYRPCRDRCHYWDCACGCSLSGIRLPGIDPEVTEVRIDNVVLDPAEYVVMEDAGFRYLERLGRNWPQWQQVRYAPSNASTFAISVRSGTYPDQIMKNAAAEIACDMLQYLGSEREEAPDGVISATAYGVTMDWRQFGSPTDQETMRVAGMSWVQRFVSTRGGPRPSAVSSLVSITVGPCTALLRRRTPLTTKTPLRSGTPLRRTPFKPAQKRRKPSVPVSVPKSSREIVERRSRGCCEARLPGCRLSASEIHHRKLRRSGDHTPVNLLHLCQWCHHGVIHANPSFSYRHGWLIRQEGDPAEVAILSACTPAACLCGEGPGDYRQAHPVDRRQNMPTNLAGGTCIGQHSVCVMRAAKLRSSCAPVGGPNSGIVTAGLVTATATPEYRETRRIEPTNGCGEIMFTYEEVGCKLRETLSGELIFHDWEMMQILFGGTLLTGRTGVFDNKVVGWASPACPEDLPAAIYLEFIVKNASQTAGDCQVAGSEFPTYTGHIFPKVQLTTGATTFNDQNINVPFDGFSVKNPNLVLGPWNDWPADGAIPSSPHIEVGYSQAQFEAILDKVRCGFQDLPVHYSG